MPPPSGPYHAHSAPSGSQSAWHRLADHLRGTGDRAACFLDGVGLADFGRAAGLLHDLGKYTPEFQRRLGGDPRKVDHSTAGAQVAVEHYHRVLGKMVAYCVAGHHAGLANGVNGDRTTALDIRLGRTVPELQTVWRREIELPPLSPPPFGCRDRDSAGLTASFLVRLLFSALVDADFLDTEAYYKGLEGAKPARGRHPSLSELRCRLDAHLGALSARAGPVNDLRREVLHYARKQAVEDPGPTGGGKTFTSLAFALDHAERHGLKRVIYVIPYMNIIEQTAAAFREALGDDSDSFVVEHHSTFDENLVTKREGREKLRLAMENWDAPIIVTTAVQFFESLFSNRPSRCRKLHNIAGSVVILDEAQTLPLPFLRPCVAAVDELARNWRASVVLCTATQPALGQESGFRGGLCGLRELAPEPERLQQSLKRTRLRDEGPLEDAEIVERLRGAPQSLCIVNTRRFARELFEAIGDQSGATHLTTLMCARHRTEVLADVRHRLEAGEPVRLIATSLVEAGVDLDFPVVWREEAGLESIIQAAGRCNREGKAKVGEVFVFRSAGRRPPSYIGKAADAARRILWSCDDPDDAMSLEAIREYFRTVYWSFEGAEELDTKRILASLSERADSWDFPFETIARDFRLIETPMVPVIVRYGGDGTIDRLINDIERVEHPGRLARCLQPYTVPTPPEARAALVASGAAGVVRRDKFGDQFVVLTDDNFYRADTGLTWDAPTLRSVEDLVM